jgi:hypothetical protein
VAYLGHIILSALAVSDDTALFRFPHEQTVSSVMQQIIKTFNFLIVDAKLRIKSDITSNDFLLFREFMSVFVPTGFLSRIFFVSLQHDCSISDSSTCQWLRQDDNCPRADGVADGEGLSGATL